MLAPSGDNGHATACWLIGAPAPAAADAAGAEDAAPAPEATG
jgi:hypothetical protein